MVVKIKSSTRPKIEAVYFCIVQVQMKLHAGGNQGGDEKQLNDLEWPNCKKNDHIRRLFFSHSHFHDI